MAQLRPVAVAALEGPVRLREDTSITCNRLHSRAGAGGSLRVEFPSASVTGYVPVLVPLALLRDVVDPSLGTLHATSCRSQP